MDNLDQVIRKKDQVFTQSKEEKDKQLLASSLFVGLGSENTINLLGKADMMSHKFRRKPKVKEAKNEEAASAHNMRSSSLSSLSNVAYEDDDYLNTLQDRGDKELKIFSPSSELLDSESLTELPLVEKLSNCSLAATSLFADNNMEIFHPPSSITASDAKEITLASSLLEGSTEYMHSSLLEIIEQPGCCLPTMDAESTANFQYNVQMEKPFTEGTISGFITYQMMDMHSVQLRFSMNLLLLDFIRPLKISTEDFGKLWLSFANDVKQNIKTSESQASLPSALKPLQQKLRLHVIDVIGNEGLLACQRLPSIPCLLHCRVHADTLTLWFRSSCSTLPYYLSYQCQKVMEGA
uniref:AP-4 complex subunit epsilon-1-like isoform X2 n=1 Tax=Castor canadensis TaxID=51338 RepID=A0A8B7W855_CASCN|nr:AP-4 complex subunit epsilon-1-like isoform X2 [Castor canadensis]